MEDEMLEEPSCGCFWAGVARYFCDGMPLIGCCLAGQSGSTLGADPYLKEEHLSHRHWAVLIFIIKAGSGGKQLRRGHGPEHSPCSSVWPLAL